MASRVTYSKRKCKSTKRSEAELLFDQVVEKRETLASSTMPKQDKDLKQKEKGKKQQKSKAKHAETEEEWIHDSDVSYSMFALDLEEVPKVKATRRGGKTKQAVLKKKTNDAKKNEKLLVFGAKKLDGDKSESESITGTPSSHVLNIEKDNCGSRKRALLPLASTNTAHLLKEKLNLKKAPQSKQSQDGDRQKYRVKNQLQKGKSNQAMLGDKDSTECVQDKDCSLERDMSNSIEIPRDVEIHSPLIPLSKLRKGSPLPQLMSSNEYNSSYCFDSVEDHEELGWVSISSGPRDQVSQLSSSKYTYISTYTEGTTTTTSNGSRKSLRTPLVYSTKRPANRNSSIGRGKYDIDQAEFPDFISPINQTNGTCKAISMTGAKRLSIRKKFSKEVIADKEKERKCSTLLFDSCSNNAQMSTFGMTTIPSTCCSGDNNQESSEISKPKSVKWPAHKQRASTPQHKNVGISLSLSSVKIPSWNEDELGLQVIESREAISSEIIVPSFLDQEESGIGHHLPNMGKVLREANPAVASCTNIQPSYVAPTVEAPKAGEIADLKDGSYVAGADDVRESTKAIAEKVQHSQHQSVEQVKNKQSGSGGEQRQPEVHANCEAENDKSRLSSDNFSFNEDHLTNHIANTKRKVSVGISVAAGMNDLKKMKFDKENMKSAEESSAKAIEKSFTSAGSKTNNTVANGQHNQQCQINSVERNDDAPSFKNVKKSKHMDNNNHSLQLRTQETECMGENRTCHNTSHSKMTSENVLTTGKKKGKLSESVCGSSVDRRKKSSEEVTDFLKNKSERENSEVQDVIISPNEELNDDQLVDVSSERCRKPDRQELMGTRKVSGVPLCFINRLCEMGRCHQPAISRRYPFSQSPELIASTCLSLSQDSSLNKLQYGNARCSD